MNVSRRALYTRAYAAQALREAWKTFIYIHTFIGSPMLSFDVSDAVTGLRHGAGQTPQPFAHARDFFAVAKVTAQKCV